MTEVNRMRLENKVAIITGAGDGIGKETALIFAREGAKVVVGEISKDKGEAVVENIKKNGGDALFIPVDVSKQDQIKYMFIETIKHFGRIDSIVNNAYGGGTTTYKGEGDLLSVTDECWENAMQTTLKSQFIATRYAVEEMLKTGGGSIVNISSVNALYACGSIAYSTAKGGVIALTRCASLQYADKNIRMNVICPATIDTASSRSIMKNRKQIEGIYPQGHIGKPQDIAHIALFLASDESAFINGQVIEADGGLFVGLKNASNIFKTNVSKD